MVLNKTLRFCEKKQHNLTKMPNTLEKYLNWANFHFCVSQAKHDGNCSIGTHRHDDFFELVLVRHGRGTHVMAERRLKIGPGSVFLIEPGNLHNYEDCEGLEIYNLLFAPGFLEGVASDLLSLPNYQLLFNLAGNDGRASGWNLLRLPDAHFPEVISLLDDILREQHERQPGARSAIMADFFKALLLLCRYAVPAGGAVGGSHAYRISRLLAELDRRIAEPWTLAAMAAESRMSVSLMRQQFKLLTGESPLAFLQRKRLAKAAALLEFGRLGIAETAALCGYGDSNYFTRLFRQAYGVTPGRARRKK